MRLSRLALAATLCLAACRRSPSPTVDPALTSCIPPGSSLIAGVDLKQLRASPLFPNLPTAVHNALDSFRDATYALVASDGSRFVIVARGRLTGATMLEPDLAVTGSPDFVSASVAQHRSGKAGAPGLVAHAPAAPLWIVADGSATLPLAGNARNLNRILHSTEYTIVSATLTAHPAIEASGVCRSEDEARALEESLRALVSVGRFATPIQLHRDGATVTIRTEVEPADLQQLLR